MKGALPVSISALSEGASEKSGELGNVPGTGQQPSGFGDAPWPVPGTLGRSLACDSAIKLTPTKGRSPASFNIRSFGSWNAAFPWVGVEHQNQPVSISALSDRGMQHSGMTIWDESGCCFNIRSFGSWNAALLRCSSRLHSRLFQYPLFRIVECSLL